MGTSPLPELHNLRLQHSEITNKNEMMIFIGWVCNTHTQRQACNIGYMLSFNFSLFYLKELIELC